MARYGLTDIQLQAQADTLRHNELLTAVLDEMQETALRSWIGAASPDKESIYIRESAHKEYRAVDLLRQQLKNILAQIEAKT
jgi:hypothetical protein